MRTKDLQCIVTFKTTTQAMLLEQAAKSAGFQGRLIPVPREITAGCGLAWREDIALRSVLEELLSNQHLEFDQIYELII